METHCGAVKSIFTHNGFHFVVLAAGIVVFACAGLVTIAERTAKGANIHGFGQGLVVVHRNGNDRWLRRPIPDNPFGQGVAVLLMLVGIGLIGTLTATVANYFVQEKANANDDRLERIEALLAQLVGTREWFFCSVEWPFWIRHGASSSVYQGEGSDGTT